MLALYVGVANEDRLSALPYYLRDLIMRDLESAFLERLRVMEQCALDADETKSTS